MQLDCMPTPRGVEDMVGKTFGRLKVIGFVRMKPVRKQTYMPVWRCRCACGRLIDRWVNEDKRRMPHSCGCAARQPSHGHNRKSGPSPEYRSWRSMKTRCYNPRYGNYHRYGGRGIAVCDRWKNSFDTFLADMGKRPPGYTLERLDVNADYCPTNCVWGNSKTQGNNKSTNVFLTVGDESMTMKQWCDKLGLNYSAVCKRWLAGWTPEQMLGLAERPDNPRKTILEHNGQKKTLEKWAEECGLTKDALRARLAKGWSVSDALGRPLRVVHRGESK